MFREELKYSEINAVRHAIVKTPLHTVVDGCSGTSTRALIGYIVRSACNIKNTVKCLNLAIPTNPQVRGWQKSPAVTQLRQKTVTTVNKNAMNKSPNPGTENLKKKKKNKKRNKKRNKKIISSIESTTSTRENSEVISQHWFIIVISGQWALEMRMCSGIIMSL